MEHGRKPIPFISFFKEQFAPFRWCHSVAAKPCASANCSCFSFVASTIDHCRRSTIMGNASSRTESKLSFVATILMVLGKPLIVKGSTTTPNGVPVTATINISFDPVTRFITVDQSGSVLVPQDVNAFNPTTSPVGPNRIFQVTGRSSLGVLSDGGDGITSYLFLDANTRTNEDTGLSGCLLSNSSPQTFFSLSETVPILSVLTSPNVAQFDLPINYASGDSLDGCAVSTNTFASLAGAGLLEGTCFFEYDADNNLNTGVNGKEVGIIWNVNADGAACPTHSPSSSPSESQAPSNQPSNSPSESLAPSNQPSNSPSESQAPSDQPTFCLKKSKTKSPGKGTKSPGKGTKSPGKGHGKGMTKSPVQTCFETAFPTNGPGKGKKDI